MEQKLIDALQRDTIAIIDRSEIEPIKERLNKLEASSLSPSRNNIQVEPDSSYKSPSTATKNWHLEH
jgi:hypothetical protein